jgi:predicted membrane-bound mannosyltransferase/DNA-binding beta-propeller fold protein YncE
MSENSETHSPSSWLDQSILAKLNLDWEKVIFAAIMIFATFTRFYQIEPRVMSHDETSHTYFSWLLYKGNGYAHDPVTHGPLQFHLVALSYFLFGDSDTSARIPAVVFSIATVWFAWYYRRYLGKAGALVAALLLTISPYMLYYGRYVRNEAFVALFGMINIWAILRYLETGRPRYIYWLTLATVLHFTAKETSYIYAAQSLLFLGLYFVNQLSMREWGVKQNRSLFFLAIIIGIILFTAGIGIRGLEIKANAPAVGSASGEVASTTSSSSARLGSVLLMAGGLVSLVVAGYTAVKDFGLEGIRQERSFNLIIVLGTLILPLLSAFIINFAGWQVPINMTQVQSLTQTQILQMGLVIVPIFLISIGVGLWWNKREWLINAGIFWGTFTVLYTTLFTNGAGFFTGLVGSLGYWLAQQGVNRGGQPWYYYIGLQIPIYEFLPLLGSLLAVLVAIFRRPSPAPSVKSFQDSQTDKFGQDVIQSVPVFGLLAFWSFTSAVAFTFAGEKMPWLTVHITLGMILLSAWVIGWMLETFDWANFWKNRGALTLVLTPVFLTSIIVCVSSFLGTNPPFQGKSLDQLSATSTFLLSFIAAVSSGIGLFFLLRNWLVGQILRLFGFGFFALLAFLTARAAFMASYINYDMATEFLVYAHSNPGIKQALSQIEEISRRTTGTLDLQVAYDDSTTYPYWWYLRNYPNQKYYAADPTRDLRNVPVILVGEKNYAKIEPVLGQAYDEFDYGRIWWPNQDYFDLTWERIVNALKDPKMRSALWQIWLNRNYKEYGEVTNKDMSLSNWYPSERMRLYIRKDIVNQLWNYGAVPSEEAVVADPYEGKKTSLTPDIILGSQGTGPSQFQKPRNLAVAPDGTLYVADTENHRIQHMTTDGTVLQTWGSFADSSKGAAPGGTFYEPWGIAVAPNGSVFVADTWNHRIQKFSPTGEFITMWGSFGQAETPTAFWGPRGLAFDSKGHLFVTDTGNKRVVIFDTDGNFIGQFGSVGMQPGEFDEPVGIAISKDDVVYVADAWNQRIQAFMSDASGTYSPMISWDVVGWYGQSLDNKPYLAVDSNDHVFASDPEGYRILEFSATGEFIRYWSDFNAGTDGLNLPVGVAVDSEGKIWVADSGNHRILRFTLPPQ